MQSVTAAQMRALEERVITEGISARALMERAGEGIYRRLEQLFPDRPRVVILAGKGHNGGDGLVVARHLAQRNWSVEVWLATTEDKMASINREILAELQKIQSTHLTFWPIALLEVEARLRRVGVAVDALFGIGLTRPLEGAEAELVACINRVREKSALQIIAIDCPSGLSESIENASSLAIQADWTITLGYPKRFLLEESAARWVGRLEVAPIFSEPAPPNPSAAENQPQLLTAAELCGLFPRRQAHSYKGNYGHVLIVGGAVGMPGAPVLAAMAVAALNIGAGLTSILVPEEIYAIAASSVPPEIMVWPDNEENRDRLLSRASVVVLGPGLEPDAAGRKCVEFWMKKVQVTIVLDAGALSVLSEHPELFSALNSAAIFTPHPGEMRRLEGERASTASRQEQIRRMSQAHPNFVWVLKGSRTLITASDHPLFVNATGNAGLAKGGSGDALAGVIGALVAQGLIPLDAARLGVWLHGRAADLALQQVRVEESLCASNAIACLGLALESLRAGQDASCIQTIQFGA